MTFQTALSGLSAASTDLNVIGNNVANSNTVGFKSSTAEFADVYAQSLSGGASLTPGIGTKLAAISQQFSQGVFQTTNNPLDLAISGNGFFQLNNNGSLSYTRDGQFQLDNNGYIVNSTGEKLTGYAVDVKGKVIAANPGPMQINTADIPPQQSTTIHAVLNLDSSSSTIPATTAINQNDATTYTSSTSFTTYDSLGNSHIATLYYQNNGGNTWTQALYVDGTAANPALSPATLTFGSNGSLTVPVSGTASASFSPTGGAVSPQALSFDIGTMTQFGSAFGVTALSQDGYASGQLNGYSIGTNGLLVGNYTNGQTRNIGQVVTANFASLQNLKSLGNNQWAETSASGQALVGVPGSGTLGELNSSTLEESNVDITTQLVSMIVAQQNYQANAQTIKTQNAIEQTLVSL